MPLEHKIRKDKDNGNEVKSTHGTAWFSHLILQHWVLNHVNRLGGYSGYYGMRQSMSTSTAYEICCTAYEIC